MSKEKKLKKEKTILQKSRRATHFSDNRWRWGEVLAILLENKIELHANDILEVGFTDGWDEGDSMRDSAYDLTVIRTREETDEEFEKRMVKKKEAVKFAKQRRYETYLELKDEFKDIL